MHAPDRQKLDLEKIEDGFARCPNEELSADVKDITIQYHYDYIIWTHLAPGCSGIRTRQTKHNNRILSLYNTINVIMCFRSFGQVYTRCVAKV